MEVKVLSRETIVPSSPTLPHLQTFQLSLFDQLSPSVYTPLLFFYARNNDKDDPRQNHEQLIATLKCSLSKTLSHFFLLSGRIVDTSICCNDEGALFVEASVNCSMSEVLKEPNNEVMSKLVPCSSLCIGPVEEYVQVVVQVNEFKCGGIVIAVCLFHKLMDATTMSRFLTSWASINREPFDSSIPNPIGLSSNYKVLSSLFPQTNLLSFHPRVQDRGISNYEQNNHCQRFVFKAKAISDLKDKLAKSSKNVVSNPTCVEVLSGFIWKHVLQAMSTRTGTSQTPAVLTHAVNLRWRLKDQPTLTDQFSVGNLVWNVIAQYLRNQNQVELSELVSLLRHSFEEVNQNYIHKFVGNEGTEAIVNLFGERGKLLYELIPKLCNFTSWRNMDLDKVDFGWGKPTWIGFAADSIRPKDNVVVLLDSMSGDGVEAWIFVDEKDMKLLLQNSEFLEFAVFNPTIPLP